MPLRLLVALLLVSSAAASAEVPRDRGSVIFFHPDGAGAGTWAAARMLYAGPDGDLEWDLLPHISVYRGHQSDNLTASSNGGATSHAYGVKVKRSAFGRTEAGPDGFEPVDHQGRSLSVAKQAIAAGLPVGLVQSGSAVEPGTAVFVSSVNARADYEEIVDKLVHSGAAVMFSGGEEWFLPEGTQGLYTQGKRTDGRNLLDEAREMGYLVIQTREQLANIPDDAEKVLGVFSEHHTFNDKPEETLRELGLPLYDPAAPTIAEMTDAALEILGRDGQQFLLIAEEEGTDNFGNNKNASGTLLAAKRSDDALGVCRRFVQANPQTLLFTTADSDGGGMRPFGMTVSDEDMLPTRVPSENRGGAPFDGVEGTGGTPFLAQADRSGRRLPFAIAWASAYDVSGGILVRAEGFNGHLVAGSMDNTDVAKLIRQTLFGSQEPTTRPSTD
ncbi:MAG: alkaline phosphatase [Planctomycetota bacterium]